MGISTRLRAVAVGLAATLATTGLAVASTGTAASAAPHYLTAPSVQIGYTDSATPRTAYDWAWNVNMPIGSHIDAAGVVHTSRVYATFDLRQVAGKRIVSGKLLVREVEAADCTKRAIEVWRTNPIQTTPSWKKAPKARERLDKILTPEFCPANITFDVDAAIAEAVARGKERISFEIRVPREFEADPSYARKLYWYTSVSLTVQYNSLPTLGQYHMYHGGQRCERDAPASHLNARAGWLQGLVADVDPNDERSLNTEFAVWPNHDPSARRVYSTSNSTPGRVAGVVVPESDLQDGRAYSWQYRTGDGADTTAWSRTCGFVVDLTQPGAPVVTSSNYPPANSGQSTPLGEPGRFTFSGGGNEDIAGFEWAWEMIGVPTCSWQSGDVGQHECPDLFAGPQSVRANAPGGTATVLISPDRVAYNRLKVRSIDAAGNRSGEVEYEIFAPWQGEPVVTVVGSDPEWGQPVTIRFAAGAGISGTNRFDYRLDDGPKQTIAAGADGTATITFTASNEYGHQVSLRSFSGNGWISPETTWQLSFYPWPTVTSDVYKASEPSGGVGVPGTFSFTRPAGWTEVKGYQYSVNGGDPIYVDAVAGRASVTWAPDTNGWNYFDVWAVRPDGTLSDYSNSYWFEVA